MDDFAKTRLGHEFLRGTLPKLVKEIGRLADGLAVLSEILGDHRTCPKCGAASTGHETHVEERAAGERR